MYSSSCGYLPSKKQSNLSGSVPHSFPLLCNYSKTTIPPNSFTKLVSSSPEVSPSLKTFDDKHTGKFSHFSSRTQSIMSFVCTLGGSSRGNRTPGICQNITGTKSRHNCKELVVHYNNMHSIPLVSSHLVGGFVGSKSQLGRTQGFEVKMWDIIRNLLSLVGSPSSAGKSYQKLSMDKRYCGNGISNSSEKHDLLLNVVKCKEVKTEKPRKQSYADVTKSKLPPSKVDCNRKTTQHSVNPGVNITKALVKKYSPSCKTMIETLSKCSNQNLSQNRNRITSECSADSEDSFIVFENCEGDIQITDDINSSEDENAFQINGGSTSGNRSAPLNTSNCGNSCKKVRFAVGKDLEKVHPMIAWDYAYRMARLGPWEMLARDRERFRCRIWKTESILKPVLEQQHRMSVYQLHFASSVT